MEQVEAKEKFYVFLDFDGVLYDLKDLAGNTKDAIKDGYISAKDYLMSKVRGVDAPKVEKGKSWPFSQDSIDALSYLMNSLSEKYSPELVIASTWRRLDPLDVKMLKSQGFDIDRYPISRTSTKGNPLQRGLAVKQYLDSTEHPGNYVILDDQTYDYEEHFPQERWIHTSIKDDRLTLDKVEKFLDSIGCPHPNMEVIEFEA